MAFSRAAALRSCFRAARPTAARPTSQLLRQVARRGYASGGHEAKSSGDAAWAAGAVIITVPTCWYLYQNGPDTSSHGHGGHGDDHAEKHEESEDKPEEEESKDEPEEKPEESEDSDGAGSQDEKSTDTADTSDDNNEHKSVPDAKEGSKKRVESQNAIKQGEIKETVGDESEEPKDKPASSKPPGSKNTQSGKQEGLSNTDTKHSIDIAGSPEKSSKAEGAPETAKLKGTVDSARPQK